jgi:hypothetical protein
MGEHTKGPWHAGGDAVFTLDGRRVICTTWGVGGPTDRAENDANTHLIAAAPDLLASLKVLINAVGNHPVTSVDEAERIALAAIAKASPALTRSKSGDA